MQQNVKHLVVDSGAFIKNAPLKDIGQKIYTVPDIASEIRDRATRQMLRVLPYEITFKKPSLESIKFATDFCKKTGDYPSLSAVDIQIIALTYQLEKELNGETNIKKEPDIKVVWNVGKANIEKATDIAGFVYCDPLQSVHLPAEEKHCSDNAVEENKEDCIETEDDIDTNTKQILDIKENERYCEDSTGKEENTGHIETGEKNAGHIETGEENIGHIEIGEENTGHIETGVENFGHIETGVENIGHIETGVENTGHIETGVENTGHVEVGEEESETDSSESQDESEEELDNEGWITTKNIKQMQERMSAVMVEQVPVDVGCITTDFAVQNVLMHMGLHIVSVNGMLIKRTKSYVLRCHACFKMTSIMTKVFCPNCGYKTLQKVSVQIDDEGNIKYFLSKKKAVRSRGLIFSLPRPQGGRYAKNPIIVEDQPVPQQRASKASRTKYSALDPDYIALSSPFAPIDTHSRAAQLGFNRQQNYWNKRNPNEARKRRK